jgi:vancomycin permeability regulator SanA
MIRNRLLRVVAMIIAVVVVAFLLAATVLVASGMRDDIHEADVAVVLGNTVNPDGLPSRRLAARLDTAVELYHRGLFLSVIVSGGVGREGFDEAVVMKDYLMRRCVPQDKIIADSQGVTTAATAKNVAAIAQEHHWTSVFVISQYFHIPRCRLALSRAGIEHVYAAHAHYFELRDVYSIFREVVGYVAYLGGSGN